MFLITLLFSLLSDFELFLTKFWKKSFSQLLLLLLLLSEPKQEIHTQFLYCHLFLGLSRQFKLHLIFYSNTIFFLNEKCYYISALAFGRLCRIQQPEWRFMSTVLQVRDVIDFRRSTIQMTMYFSKTEMERRSSHWYQFICRDRFFCTWLDRV